MIWLILLIIFLVALYEAYHSDFVKKYRNIYKFSKTLPGPSFKELMNNKGPGLMNWFTELSGRYGYGKIFKIWIGKDLSIFISHPDDVKTMLSSNNLLYKSHQYEIMRPWLLNGLLTNGGRTWHDRRKMLTPAFHFNILGSFKKPMEDSCKILVEKLNAVADGTPIDINPYIVLFSLDVITETAMGVQIDAQIKSETEYIMASKSICKKLHDQAFSPWQRIPFLYNLSWAKKTRDQLLKTLHGETQRVIKIRRSLLSPNNVEASNCDDDAYFGSKRRLAFLDILLLAQIDGKNLTDENIQEEVDTFMFEGHDTTSAAISFTIYLLSRNPEAQAKAYEEVCHFIGKETEPMPYLEAVIKESLRLYPPVPLYGRRVDEPFVIGGITVPAGVYVTLSCFLTHTNPDFFQNPFDFIPERFLDGREMHPFSFVPFSAGPRNCIGQKFAMLELKCSISILLRSFEFLRVDGFEVNAVPELVIKSSNGVQVRIKKRKID